MALTPEDVLNKNFTATQFRRGYDEQEVDDFLDEVVAELRRLGGENAELARKAQSGGAPAPAAAGPARPDVEDAERQAAERIRRQKRRRSRRQRARMLDDKRQHAAKKALRGPVRE